MSLVEAIESVLAERGPLTGAELAEAVGRPIFPVWKACRSSGRFDLRVIGRRYVRMDRKVEQFARLSPSILREFLTYTVIGLPGSPEENERAARTHEARIRVISRDKLRTAERVADDVVGTLLGDAAEDDAPFCLLVAGDIVYDMSHDVPRHESSTGSLVQGSDLDLVALVTDDATDALVTALDELILKRKWFYLRHPVYHEEVDYVVKRFSRLQEQAGFDTFPHMVACKVFDEARFLRGNRALHDAGLALLRERGVIARLRELEKLAIENRVGQEQYLLSIEGDEVPQAGIQRWYTDDEAAEFEH